MRRKPAEKGGLDSQDGGGEDGVLSGWMGRSLYDVLPFRAA